MWNGWFYRNSGGRPDVAGRPLLVENTGAMTWREWWSMIPGEGFVDKAKRRFQVLFALTKESATLHNTVGPLPIVH